ncbi:MAG TPA: sensor histidine kinase [Chloroflexota bacterium]|nr:sensor histidine kinase [Chloroflexota bacterium]
MRGHCEQGIDAVPVPGDGAEQALGAASAAAQGERQRLARDLHDTVTQTLIGLQLTAQAAADLWDTQPDQARAALETVRHLTGVATTELRALLVDLHEAALERHGLIGALEAYSAVVRRRSGLPVEIRVGGRGATDRAGTAGQGERLPAAHEEALYRVVREALANVVKHARATRAAVTLVRDTTVRLSVEDDGVGFGAPAPAFADGLTGMRERVGALGGTLRLENRPGGGARVVAEFPSPADRE